MNSMTMPAFRLILRKTSNYTTDLMDFRYLNRGKFTSHYSKAKMKTKKILPLNVKRKYT